MSVHVPLEAVIHLWDLDRKEIQRTELQQQDIGHVRLGHVELIRWRNNLYIYRDVWEEGNIDHYAFQITTAWILEE